MGFYLRRYGNALRAYKPWMLLTVLAVILYLGIAALTDITYSVYQDFEPHSGDIPIAASMSPVDTITINAVAADPDLLFLDSFALTTLQNKLELMATPHSGADNNALRRLVHTTLALSATPESGLRLSYTGKDLALGSILVGFYTDRLLRRIDDGFARAQPQRVQTPGPFRTAGDLLVVAKRSVWSADRLRPALFVLLLSFLGLVVLIGLFELADPSFKSERQIARYLGLPVLGAIPDAEPLVRTLPDRRNDT